MKQVSSNVLVEKNNFISCQTRRIGLADDYIECIVSSPESCKYSKSFGFNYYLCTHKRRKKFLDILVS